MQRKHGKHTGADRSPLVISGLYVVVSIMWIIFSDMLVETISGESASMLSFLQTVKGGFFVAVTGLMLYFLVKSSLNSLKESEERFRALAENSPDAITRFDRERRYLYANAILENQTGIPVEGFIGKTHTDLNFPAELCELWENAIDTVFSSQQPNRIEFQLPSGRWIDWILSPEFSNSGEVSTVIAAARDITQTREAVKALEAGEKRYRTLFEAAGDGVLLLDASGIVDCNQQALKLFGVGKKEEIVGRHPRELSPTIQANGKGSEEFSEEMAERASSGTPQIFEWKHRTRTGDEIDVSVSLSIVDSETGTFVAILRNITELMNAREQLRQSQKMQAIGQLAGGIAHDFNNMLGPIIGYADMLLGEVEGDKMLTGYAENILKAGRRAGHLVSQILTFSRRGPEERVPTNLRPVVREVMELLRASLPSTVELTADIRKDTVPVIADSTKVHEALMNLSTNAVHAMDERGTLSIELHEQTVDKQQEGILGPIEPGFYSIMEVKDTGVGMDERLIAHIFEPFYTTKSENEGTGLGLSVVYGIMQSHGGNILVESGVGKGTVFKLLFPKAPRVTVTESEQRRSPAGGDERILFVDDEKALAELGEIMLTSLGYTVTAVTDSNEALRIFTENPSNYDLLITDQTMPHRTGIELTREILRIAPEFPIILCTGYSNKVNEKTAKEIGCREFATKPLTKRVLAEKVRSALDR